MDVPADDALLARMTARLRETRDTSALFDMERYASRFGAAILAAWTERLHGR